MSALAVWMYGRRIGTLTRSRGRLAFAYTEHALDLGLGRPLLSVSMPVRARPWTGSAPHAFFNGLLPEGEPRRMIAHDFGVEDGDVFGMLEALGRDCAGALVVVPQGDEIIPDGRPEPIDDAEVADRIRRLQFAPLGVDRRIRVLLAGTQEKLLLARLRGAWALPVDGAPSTHIVKPAHPLLADSIDNEALCMRLAKHLGVRVAEVEIIEPEGLRAISIVRFDRSVPREDGTVARLHQEDLCQAHSLEPRHKYESAGGPSLRRCARILDQWTRGRPDLERLLDLTLLNVLIGNADAHAKSLALLHDPAGGVTLAPAYDLLSTTHYPAVSRIPGMLVNGREDLDEVTRRDVIAEAVGWGLPAGIAEDRVADLLSRAPDALGRAAEEIGPVLGLVRTIEQRADRLGSS